jgi:hypothetical protein
MFRIYPPCPASFFNVDRKMKGNNNNNNERETSLYKNNNSHDHVVAQVLVMVSMRSILINQGHLTWQMIDAGALQGCDDHCKSCAPTV